MRFFGGLGRIISITGFTVVAAYIMVSVFPLNINDTGLITLGVKLSLIATVTFAVHLDLSSLFGLEEAVPIFRKIKSVGRAIMRPLKIEGL